MKILMTADAIGGVWTYALELSRGLRTHDVQVVLAVMGGPLTDAQRSQAGSIPNLSVRESEYRLEWMTEPWRDVQEAGDWLLRIERETAPDLIHLNNFCHGQLFWRAPSLIVAHSEVSSWFRHVRGTAPPQEWEEYRDRVSEGLYSTGFVIAPSSSALRDLQREYGPLPRARVIPNGTSRFDAGTAMSPLKEEFVLSVGRLWDDAKNIRSLDRIAPSLAWPILAAGSLKSPSNEEIALRGLKVLGELPRERLSGIFARASIYALPARYEPFGLSVLEAAACGCALVLGDIPSLRENWDGAALFADPDSPENIRDAIASLIRSGEERRRLGILAEERSRKFSAEAMAHAYHDVYRKLALTRIAA